MSSIPELSKGARKRIPVRERCASETRSNLPVYSGLRARPAIEEEVTDSGLSSESTTPVGGSPPPRQPQRSIVTPQNVSALIAASRARLEKSRISSSRTSRLLKSRSGTDSPRSLDSVRSGSKQVYSPLRTPRNVQSPSIDSGDEGSLRMDRGTYQYMSQDIVCIKTMLLKLKRILQEAEPLNPFDSTVKNGLFYNLNEGESVDTTSENGSVADELADLRRQVVFLQGQLEDKDRTIQSLQLQLTKHPGLINMDSSGNYEPGTVETCNAATQTEKVRPISAGPSLLESLPQNGNIGPLVSWSNSWEHQPRPSVLTETHPRSVRKPSARLSLLQKENDENDYSNERDESTGIITTNRLSNGKENPVKNSSPLKIESTSPKSAIPTPRRLATPTLIPRAARAISATGRSHNT